MWRNNYAVHTRINWSSISNGSASGCSTSLASPPLSSMCSDTSPDVSIGVACRSETHAMLPAPRTQFGQISRVYRDVSLSYAAIQFGRHTESCVFVIVRQNKVVCVTVACEIAHQLCQLLHVCIMIVQIGRIILKFKHDKYLKIQTISQHHYYGLMQWNAVTINVSGGTVEMDDALILTSVARRFGRFLRWVSSGPLVSTGALRPV